MLVSTQEFVNTIRQIQKVSNQSTDAQVWDIIHQFDHNKDGFIEADEILKVNLNPNSIEFNLHLGT
jgi:Ca2+-binding EF-hand superfamily protein